MVAAVFLAAGLPCAVGRQPGERPAPVPPPADSPLVIKDDKQPDPYEDRPIREVRLLRVEASGVKSALSGPNVQLVRNQIRSVEGRPFRRQTVINDISTLSGLGRFKTIASEVQMQTDGSVVLIYTLGEQPVIQDVQIVGNRVITDQEALDVAGALSGTAVDRFEIDRAARGIENLYREKGYYAVRVEVDEKELASSSILVYRVIEGEKVRVMGVQFRGNAAFTPRELRTVIRTTEFIPVFEKGPLDDEVVKDDAAQVSRFYKDRGYIDVRVSYEVRPSPDAREAIVTFEVEEGPRYTLRSVQVRYTTAEALNEYRRQFGEVPGEGLTAEQMAKLGRRSFSNEQIAGLIPLKAGDAYSVDKLNKSKDAIRAAYGMLGHVGENEYFGPGAIEVREREVRNPDKPEVDLVLRVDEGRAARVGNVRVGRNEKTRQQVILRQIQTKPERPLNVADVAESRKRLEETRLFEPRSVKATILQQDEFGLRDILYEVKETNTGEVNFGVLVDSDAELMGSVSIVQRNFDLMDPPGSLGEWASMTGFRGGGQTASLTLIPGNLTQRYSVSLLEPSFFDSDFSARGQLYYNARQYTVYDERRVGAAFGMGRRFGTVWEGSAGVKVESVEISDVEPTRPVDLFAVQGENFATALSASFARDTTDDKLRPSRGALASLTAEQFGALGGDYDFTRLSASYKVFLPVYESFLGYKTVLKFETAVGYIPQGQDSAPLFERFYLGGQSFRGFANRAVSPMGVRNDTGQVGTDPVGGAFKFFFGSEISQPLYQDILAAVAFIDTGTVQTSPGLDQYRVSVGVGARVFVPLVSPVPLAFDFGYPIVREDSDRIRVFTFSIDVPF